MSHDGAVSLFSALAERAGAEENETARIIRSARSAQRQIRPAERRPAGLNSSMPDLSYAASGK